MHVNAKQEKSELDSRLSFMKLDAEASQAIASVQSTVTRVLPGVLDTFCYTIRQTPEVARFFQSDSDIGRAKAAQIKHWESISAGRF